jgi:magnesium chelatase subunit I
VHLPYTELVRHPGTEALHTALELSVLATARGYPLHVHAEGLRGTGKTTIIRAAARLLPTIVRIAGCPYNCDPAYPHCPLHRDLPPAEVLRLGTEAIQAPFLEISPSAKIGTVVGCIDLQRLTDAERPQAALLPGTLARAHRGVVFVDEVNRLADTSPELADALLDVMGTKPGRLQIEETGLPPVTLTCRVTVWAASNPDEEPGPLADVRRQLADRFDLVVAMRRPADPATVLAVLAREDAARPIDVPAPDGPQSEAPAEGAAGPSPVRAAGRPGGDGTARLRLELQALAGLAAPALPGELQELIAAAYCDFQVESLRAVQAWQAAARLLALRRGAASVEYDDVRRTAALALRHRLEPEELARLLDRLEGTGPAERAAPSLAASVSGPTAAPPAEPAPGAARPGPLAQAADRARIPWWRRWAGGAGAGAPRGTVAPALAGESHPAAPALADPSALPPLAPTSPARLLPELPPGEWLTPAEGDGA